MDCRDIHILAVDDSYLDRKVVERLLVNSSYKVTTVDSALRALEVLGIVGTSPVMINAVKINLIITDYCMPEMTGYDLLKKVKESSALKEIPVVIMSSENVAERITMCLEEGAKEFILKPLRAADAKRLRTHVKDESGGCCLLEDSDSSSVFKRKPVPALVNLAEQLPALLKRPRRTENSKEVDSTTCTTSSGTQEEAGPGLVARDSEDGSSSGINNSSVSTTTQRTPRDEGLVSGTQDSITSEKPVVDQPSEGNGDGLSSRDGRSLEQVALPTSSRSVSSTEENRCSG